MRIDLNHLGQTGVEGANSSSPNAASGANRPPANSALEEDQAQLSGSHLQAQVLTAQVLQFPEMRQEKVTALREAVLNGSYHPSASEVANAVFDQLVTAPAA
jgi:flagellar biosynthesis anti-sigma factor FlgM